MGLWRKGRRGDWRLGLTFHIGPRPHSTLVRFRLKTDTFWYRSFVHTNRRRLRSPKTEENETFRKRSPEWIDSKTPFSYCSVHGENGAFRKRSPEWIHSKTPFSCCSVDGENGAFRKRSPEWIRSKTPFSCCSVDGKISMRFRYEVTKTD